MQISFSIAFRNVSKLIRVNFARVSTLLRRDPTVQWTFSVPPSALRISAMHRRFLFFPKGIVVVLGETLSNDATVTNEGSLLT
jgi:hypothetical protein